MSARDIFYKRAEHYGLKNLPALRYQIDTYHESRPLNGLSILDATPVFNNTILKHLVLRSMGADVTISIHDGLPYSQKAVDELKELGFPFHESGRDDYDVICDCGGFHSHMHPCIGFVELTRTGAKKYDSATRPVINVDGGYIKELETVLGTGDGLIRALNQLHIKLPLESVAVVFGYGKVGRGVAYRLWKEGYRVVVIDDWNRIHKAFPFGSSTYLNDQDMICHWLERASLVVTATGVKDALDKEWIHDALLDRYKFLANIGVEDEFGSSIPEDRVLNRKRPINFLLEEPTQIQYVEPTMALDNEAVMELVVSIKPSGLYSPKYENHLISRLRGGSVYSELKKMPLDERYGLFNRELLRVLELDE